MKKVIFSLIALVACITIQAAEISQQQAMAKARAFLSQQSGVRRAAADIQLQTAATGVRQLHAFNMEGGGYVIVSSSSRTRDILAYAPQGALGDQMPPAMMELLKSYAAQITEVEQDGEDAEQDDAADDHLVKYEIVPLVSQRWGQEMPYNKLTPMVKDSDGNDVHGATGCVATAMAMVMKYHQWPKAQTPTLPATEYTTELPPVTFNWAAMTDTYSEQSSKESCDAVATLMLYCGAACQMEYGTMSSSNSYKMALGFIRFFGYDSDSIEVTRRTFVTEWEWQNMIYKELEKKRPVICGGDGHEFIIDGYQFGDFFHINWGWEGNRDGFFQLSVNANARKKTLPHFPYDVVTGIIPTDKAYTCGEALFTSGFMVTMDTPLQLQRTGDTDFPAVKVLMTLKNQSRQAKTFTYDTGLALYQDKKLVKAIGAAMGKPVKHNSYLENVQASITFGQGLADGHYKLYPVSRVQGSEQWEQNEDVNDNFIDVDIKGQQLTLTPHPRDLRLKVNSINFSGTLKAGSEVTAVMNITNGSDFDFDGVLILGESADGTMNSANSLKENYANIPAGKTVDIVFKFIAGEAKTYQTCLIFEAFVLGNSVPMVIIPNDGTVYYDDMVLEKTVKLKNVQKEGTSGDGKKQYDVMGRELDITLSLRNPDAENTYKGKVSLIIYKREPYGDNFADTPISEQTQESVIIAPGTSTDVKFYYDQLEYADNYAFWIRTEYRGDISSDTKPIYSCVQAVAGINVFKHDRTVASFAPQNVFAVPDDAVAVELNGAGVSTLTPNSNPNCLYFLDDTDPKPASLEGRNVVVYANSAFTAETIRLTDGYDFMTPRWFTAKQIEYKRTFTESERNTFTTLLLPFTAQKVEAEGESFTLERLQLAADQAGKVYFANTPDMPSVGIPYLVRLKSDKVLTHPVTFSAANAYVCDSIYMQTAGRYNMTGAFLKMQDASVETFAFADGQGSSVVPKATTCSPFRACFQAIGIPTGFESLTIDTTAYNATAIDVQRHEADDHSHTYYNLSGQRVLQPRRGLYIHDGKKVVIK